MGDDHHHHTKRSLTAAGRSASTASFTTSATSLVSPDLLAQLQNVGSRVRRSVIEGYNTDRFSSEGGRQPLSRSTSSSVLPLGATPIFRSNNDIMHDLNTTFQGHASTNSLLKRGRIDEEPDADQGSVELGARHGDSDANDGASVAQKANTAATHSESRPMKPLRAPRTFGVTQSLPAGIFGSAPHRAHTATTDAQQSGGPIEEEDWSASAFAGSFNSAQAPHA